MLMFLALMFHALALVFLVFASGALLLEAPRLGLASHFLVTQAFTLGLFSAFLLFAFTLSFAFGPIGVVAGRWRRHAARKA